MTRDGKRHVSMGRGYTMCNLPDPHPEMESMIHREYEKRTTVRKIILFLSIQSSAII